MDSRLALCSQEKKCSVLCIYTCTFVWVTLAAPYWIKEPDSDLYAPKETVKLDCQADGIPTPQVTWTVNGNPLSGNCTVFT